MNSKVYILIIGISVILIMIYIGNLNQVGVGKFQVVNSKIILDTSNGNMYIIDKDSLKFDKYKWKKMVSFN